MKFNLKTRPVGGANLTMSTRSRSHSTLRPILRQRSSERSNKLTKSSPASRSSSPSHANRRVAKLNMYLSKSAKNSTDQLQRTASVAPEFPRSTNIRRWDGNRRMTIKWDSIRRVSTGIGSPFQIYHHLIKLLGSRTLVSERRLPDPFL